MIWAVERVEEEAVDDPHVEEGGEATKANPVRPSAPFSSTLHKKDHEISTTSMTATLYPLSSPLFFVPFSPPYLPSPLPYCLPKPRSSGSTR